MAALKFRSCSGLVGSPSGLILLGGILPVLVAFTLPAIETVAHVTKASGALLEAVSSGELTPSEAAEIAKLLDTHTRAVEAFDLEERLRALEADRR